MKYRVLKFGATWCGPCKKLSEELNNKPINLNHVSIEEINVDDNEELTEHYGIRSIPTSIIIDDKHNEIARLVGYNGYQNYVNWIKDNTHE